MNVRKFRVWLAAPVVAGVFALSVAACSASGGASVSASSVSAATVSASSATDTVPEYYAEATAAGSPAYSSPDNISIRDTYTGGVLATVRPPGKQESFGYVFAGSKPDTWVAGAQPWHPVRLDDSAQPVTLYALVFDPATKRVTLTRLPAKPVPGTDLEAAALSPDGTRLAEVVLEPGPLVKYPKSQSGNAFLRLYTMAGSTVTTTSRQLAMTDDLSILNSYSLTWIGGDETVAVGGPLGSVRSSFGPSSVLYLDTAAPRASRTVTLSFPPSGSASFNGATATPTRCYDAPVATSDGQHILCDGYGATPVNAAGYTNVGIWAFSAQTGDLTTTRDRHSICCALSSTDFPRVIWASPGGDAIVATGLAEIPNQGATLDISTPDGKPRQIPWPGLIHEPELLNIIEPAIAW